MLSDGGADEMSGGAVPGPERPTGGGGGGGRTGTGQGGDAAAAGPVTVCTLIRCGLDYLYQDAGLAPARQAFMTSTQVVTTFKR